MPALPRGLESPLRTPAAAAALVAAAAHVPVTGEHLHEVPYVGVLFVLLEVACAVGALLLVARDAAGVWGALGTACAAAVLAYVVSRGIGLPGMPDDVGDWANPLGVVSVAAESLVAVLAAAALLGRRAAVPAPAPGADPVPVVSGRR